MVSNRGNSGALTPVDSKQRAKSNDCSVSGGRGGCDPDEVDERVDPAGEERDLARGWVADVQVGVDHMAEGDREMNQLRLQIPLFQFTKPK